MLLRILVFIVIINGTFEYSGGVTVLEYLFGPKLGTVQQKSARALTTNQAEQLIQSFGYPSETHEITSEDGYITEVHRIPKGRKRRSFENRIPVIIVPGFLSVSDVWLFRGPKRDLPYILADSNFDVWISNLRGSYYARKHRTLDANKDRKFWNFTMHEMGLYDLPAVIDYVLNNTKMQQVHLIGYSIGGTIGLITCSLKPEYNAKIRLFMNLAPIAYNSNNLAPALKYTLTTFPPILQMLISENIYELFPRRKYFGDIGEMLCKNEAATHDFCTAAMFLVTGFDYVQFNSSMFPTIFRIYPAGTSVKVAVHIYQMLTTGNFESLYQKVDRRARDSPLTGYAYNMSNVVVPTSLHYGDGDNIARKQDVELLAKKLPNVVGVFRIPYPDFNHIDFMWATDSRKLLYDELIRLMNKYK